MSARLGSEPETGSDFRFDVFISYAQRDPDGSWVRTQLVPSLEGRGLRVALDSKDFVVGVSLTENMQRCVEMSRYVVAVVSPDYFSRAATKAEYTMALQLALETSQSHLIVAKYRDCEMPLILRSNLWVDFREPDSFKHQVERLVEAIRGAAPVRATIEPVASQSELALKAYVAGITDRATDTSMGSLIGDLASLVDVDDVYVRPRLSWVNVLDPSGGDDRTGETSLRDQQRLDDQERIDKPDKPASDRLYTAFARSRSFALVGSLGQGKTSAARYAIRSIAGNNRSRLGLTESLVPFLVPLGKLAGSSESLDDTALRLALSTMPGRLMAPLTGELEAAWADGRALLIVDGVDEFRGEREWLRAEVLRLSGIWPGRMVVASRPGAIATTGLASMASWAVADLDSVERQELIERWSQALSAVRPAASKRLGQRTLATAIDDSGYLRAMAANPLFLTLLIGIAAASDDTQWADMIRSEGDLFRRYVRGAIDWEKGKSREEPAALGVSWLTNSLGRIGIAALSADTRGGPPTLSRASLEPMLRGDDERPTGMNVEQRTLEFWLRTGIVELRDHPADEIRFSHEAFKIAAAALGIRAMNSSARQALLEWVATPKSDDAAVYGSNAQWREAVNLFLGMSAE